MNKNTKYYLGISVLIVLDCLKNLFFSSDLKIDVYYFYDHARYLDNILYDISNLFKFSIFSYWLISLSRKTFKPLFITSIFSWIFYFVFYNGFVSLLIIPIYLILTIMYNFKRKK